MLFERQTGSSRNAKRPHGTRRRLVCGRLVPQQEMTRFLFSRLWRNGEPLARDAGVRMHLCHRPACVARQGRLDERLSLHALVTLGVRTFGPVSAATDITQLPCVFLGYPLK